MADGRKFRPSEALRELAFSLERRVVKEAASSAAEGLRDELPAIDDRIRSVLDESVALLGRAVREAAGDRTAGEIARTVSAGAVRGALDELEREQSDDSAIGIALHRLQTFLEQSSAFTQERHSVIRSPERTARAAGAALAEGAVAGVERAWPALENELRALGPLGAEIAGKVATGLAAALKPELQGGAQFSAGLAEEAGRRLAQAVASTVADELAARAQKAGGLGNAVANVTEQAAAAAVRGAVDELARQLPRLRRGGRELTRGVLASVREALRSPVLIAGAAAIVFTGIVLAPRRTR